MYIYIHILYIRCFWATQVEYIRNMLISLRSIAIQRDAGGATLLLTTECVITGGFACGNFFFNKEIGGKSIPKIRFPKIFYYIGSRRSRFQFLTQPFFFRNIRIGTSQVIQVICELSTCQEMSFLEFQHAVSCRGFGGKQETNINLPGCNRGTSKGLVGEPKNVMIGILGG